MTRPLLAAVRELRADSDETRRVQAAMLCEQLTDASNQYRYWDNQTATLTRTHGHSAEHIEQQQADALTTITDCTWALVWRQPVTDRCETCAADPDRAVWDQHPGRVTPGPRWNGNPRQTSTVLCDEHAGRAG